MKSLFACQYRLLCLLLHNIECKCSFCLSLLITGILTRVTRVTSRTGTAYPFAAREFTSGFQLLNLLSSVVLYRALFDRCLSFCTFSFWPLCCLFFFDIRFLIAPLVASNSSSSFFFGYCIVCPLIYAFWSPLWYHKTFHAPYTILVEDTQYNHIYLFSFRQLFEL